MVHTTDSEDTSETYNVTNCVPLTKRRDFFSFLEITVKSSPKNIHELIKKMRNHFIDLKIDQDIVEDLVLLIDEAVTNTAEHAHEFDRQKEVIVRITIKPSKIQIFVKGDLKEKIINNEKFHEFLKRLLIEKIITIKKANDFVREFVNQNLISRDKAKELKDYFQSVEQTEESGKTKDIDSLLADFLDERGRGMTLIKQLTGGKVKLDIIGKTLTIVMTKNLSKPC